MEYEDKCEIHLFIIKGAKCFIQDWIQMKQKKAKVNKYHAIRGRSQAMFTKFVLF